MRTKVKSWNEAMTLDECEEIFDRAIASPSEAEFCHVVEPLLNEYKTLSIELGRGNIFWRARVIDSEIYKNISDLQHPPAKFARQGRLNDNGEPCFYIATREETALAEVNATEGQMVQVAGFRIKVEFPIRLIVIGEYANVQKNGYMHFAGSDPDFTIAKILNSMPRQEALKILYIDKFLASILADPNASASDYRFCRALGRMLYSKNNAEGIVFPSVKDRGGFNIAVQAASADRCFHNVSCLLAEMGKPRKFGVTEYSIIRSAERLDDNLDFIWKNTATPEEIGIYNIGKAEFDVASGEPNHKERLMKLLHPHRW